MGRVCFAVGRGKGTQDETRFCTVQVGSGGTVSYSREDHGIIAEWTDRMLSLLLQYFCMQ